MRKITFLFVLLISTSMFSQTVLWDLDGANVNYGYQFGGNSTQATDQVNNDTAGANPSNGYWEVIASDQGEAVDSYAWGAGIDFEGIAATAPTLNNNGKFVTILFRSDANPTGSLDVLLQLNSSGSAGKMDARANYTATDGSWQLLEFDFSTAEVLSFATGGFDYDTPIARNTIFVNNGEGNGNVYGIDKVTMYQESTLLWDLDGANVNFGYTFGGNASQATDQVNNDTAGANPSNGYWEVIASDQGEAVDSYAWGAGIDFENQATTAPTLNNNGKFVRILFRSDANPSGKLDVLLQCNSSGGAGKMDARANYTATDGSWQLLEFDFSTAEVQSFATGGFDYDTPIARNTIFVNNGEGNGNVYGIDQVTLNHVSLYKDSTVLWDIDNAEVNFGYTFGGNASQATDQTNNDKAGANTSDGYWEVIASNQGETVDSYAWGAGIDFEGKATIVPTFNTNGKYVTILFRSDANPSGSLDVLLQCNSSGGAGKMDARATYTATDGSWELLEFDFSTAEVQSFATGGFTYETPIARNTIFVNNGEGNGNVYGIDQITMHKKSKTLSTNSFVDNNKNKITMWPVPTNNVLNFRGDVEGSKVQILDVLGKVLSVNTLDSQKSIDVSNLSKGVYFATFGRGKSLRFIKN